MVDATRRVRHRLTARQSLAPLASSPAAELDTDSWWDSVALHVGRLRQELAAEDIAGLVDQTTAEVPEQAHLAARLWHLHDRVLVEAERMEQLLANRGGTPRSGEAARNALKDLLGHVHRVCLQTDKLLLDAYELDIGGGD